MSTGTIQSNKALYESARRKERVHYVGLKALPDGLQFPSELQDKIWFEHDAKRLAFCGFMSKAVFDRLDSLKADPNYQRALEELFQESSYEDTVGPRYHRVPWVVGAVLVAAAAFLTCAAILLVR